MRARSLAAALVALFAFTALAPGLALAQTKEKAYNPFTPDNIKRIPAKLDSVSGMSVKFKTMDGIPFTLTAMNPKLLLFKDMKIGDPRQIKPGDKLIVYYNAPPVQGEMKLLWAIMDPPSEILLVEMRAKPIAATFKSFKAASRQLTVQTNGRAKTYTVVAPVMAVREAKEAVLGKADSEEKRGYSSGDKLLLIMTADRKQVRMVMDRKTYDLYAPAIKKFPVPPASKIPKK